MLRAVSHVVTQVLYGSGIGVGGTPVSPHNGGTVPLGTLSAGLVAIVAVQRVWFHVR